jgi:excisionase family DNA binding protein
MPRITGLGGSAVGNRLYPVVVVAPRADRPEPNLVPLDREWLSYAEAARIIGVSDRTVRTYCKQGQLPWFKLGYKTVKIPRKAVQEFVERHLPSAVRNVA